jgi:hypothetical protein
MASEVERSSDLYLEDFRDDLQTYAGKTINLATVWRYLRRKGFTMKQVSHQILADEDLKLTDDRSHVQPWRGADASERHLS